jgi:hypothetical protein
MRNVLELNAKPVEQFFGYSEFMRKFGALDGKGPDFRQGPFHFRITGMDEESAAGQCCCAAVVLPGGCDV